MANTSLQTMNENVLAALDVETTGRQPWYNEVIQVAVVPLDCHIKPVGKPFYTNICPFHLDRMTKDAIDAHGIQPSELLSAPNPDTAAESLWEWYQDLHLPPGKRLIPLCHNSQFDIPFMQAWLGMDLFNDIFGYPGRDTQYLISALMDKASFKGQPLPFNRTRLAHVCEVLGIDLVDAHDALADAVATASVYRHLLNLGGW